METIDKYVWYQEGPGVRKSQYTIEGTKLLNVSNLVDGKIDLSTSHRYISNEEANGKYSHFLVDEGDLIIASSGIQVDYFDKKMGFAKKEHLPLCMNTSTIRFKVLNEKITNIRYFMYFLKSNILKRQLQKLITGSAQLNFGSTHLKKIKIEMPVLEEQQHIANKLDKLQEIIDLRKKQIEELEELVKAEFAEMFDIATYKERQLSECSSFIDYRGHTPKVSSKGVIRMINAKSVGKGIFKYIDEYVTEELYKEWMNRGFANPGDVLFVTEGHTFGNTCRIPKELKKFALGQRVITIQGKSMLNNIFLCYYMQQEEFKNKINMYKTGGTAQGIRSRDLLKVKVPLPPLELQNRFATIVQQVDNHKSELQKSLQQMQDLQESLMNRFFE